MRQQPLFDVRAYIRQRDAEDGKQRTRAHAHQSAPADGPEQSRYAIEICAKLAGISAGAMRARMADPQVLPWEACAAYDGE